jgi:hypothetical protein
MRLSKRKVTKNKRRYKKLRYTRKKKQIKSLKRKIKVFRGGNFNNEQQEELISMLHNKGLSQEEINQVMNNLNMISQSVSNKFWFQRIKREINALQNRILENGNNSFIRWSQEVRDSLLDIIKTDSEDL